MPYDLSRYEQIPPTPAQVRLAKSGDVRALAEVLAKAFDDDPLSAYLLRGESRRRSGLRRIFSSQIRTLIDSADLQEGHGIKGEVWTTRDRSAAALWVAPVVRSQRWAEMGHMLRVLPTFIGGGQLSERVRLMNRISAARPNVRHWYLATIGTAPESQGTGSGSALLKAKLSQIDEQGLPAFLESSKRRNLPLYARHGFEVTGEIQEPDGPTIWLMWRKGLSNISMPSL